MASDKAKQCVICMLDIGGHQEYYMDLVVQGTQAVGIKPKIVLWQQKWRRLLTSSLVWQKHT